MNNTACTELSEGQTLQYHDSAQTHFIYSNCLMHQPM